MRAFLITGLAALMDDYTKQQKTWLDKRFREHDQNGVYLAHEPVYGFRENPSEPGHTGRYIITYQIMQSMANLDFKSFLDAGGGEGYKAFVVRRLLGVDGVVTDLSEEACKRAGDLYSLPGITADLHNLPFVDGAFDLVLCSESLEHVADFRGALSELLRITRHSLIITVPHEPPKAAVAVAHHAHINTFTTSSLSYLHGQGVKVTAKRILSPMLTIPAALVDATARTHNPAWKHPGFMTGIYNGLVPFVRKVFGTGAVKLIVRLDGLLSNLFRCHKGILFHIAREESVASAPKPRQVSVEDILQSTVPRLKIGKHAAAAD